MTRKPRPRPTDDEAKRQPLFIGSGDELRPGEMAVYATARPPLSSGEYVVSATQTVEIPGVVDPVEPFVQQQPLHVSGARFDLPPGTVQMVYPPSNDVGPYEFTLPNIVLTERTLPWVRTMDGAAVTPASDAPPWMAVLVLAEDEIGEARVHAVDAPELLKPGNPAILPPAIPKESLTPAERCQAIGVIDLDLPTFLGTAPLSTELAFLGHVRHVNTDGKVILGIREDGWFSVVVGNRLPPADRRCTAFLVSLEGHQDHLPDTLPSPGSFTAIRLVVLASWSFTVEKSRGDFIGIMQAIPERGGDALLQARTTTLSPPPGDPEPAYALAREAVEIGYLPLFSLQRSGEGTTSFYRGPFSPVPTKADPNGPYYYSDRALRYDPASGVFDESYAVAWQIGRLVALSDAVFTRAFLAWLDQAHLRRTKDEALRDLARRLSAAPLPAGADPETHGRRLVFDQVVAIVSGFAAGAGRPEFVRHRDRADHLLPGLLPASRDADESFFDPVRALLDHVHGRPR